MSKHTAEILLTCPACGAEPRRDSAKFCATCGRVMTADYRPMDSLWASYNLQKRGSKTNLQTKPKQQELRLLFEKNKNNASTTAMAFVVYSLVPYLGILFCPGALVMGGIGLAVSYQKPQLGGRQTAVISLMLGVIVLSIQILLWWLLYLIPELK